MYVNFANRARCLQAYCAWYMRWKPRVRPYSSRNNPMSLVMSTL